MSSLGKRLIKAAKEGRSIARNKAGKNVASQKNKHRLRLQPKASERSTYKKAYDLALREGETERVAKLLRESHKHGDRRATYALATWYMHGGFFAIDKRKAFLLLRRCKDTSISEALFDLAVSYETGFGTDKSTEKALEFYIRSSGAGDADALNEVVRCVYWGIGTKKNPQLAGMIEDLFQSRIKFDRRTT